MPSVEISNGELIDRFSILQVKRKYLATTYQETVIQAELDQLLPSVDKLFRSQKVRELSKELYKVNESMWLAMQGIYDWVGDRSQEFQDLVLSVIEINKQRAFVKREIDEITDSRIREAKSFFATGGS